MNFVFRNSIGTIVTVFDPHTLRCLGQFIKQTKYKKIKFILPNKITGTCFHMQIDIDYFYN